MATQAHTTTRGVGVVTGGSRARSGNTGLVGGGVPIADEVILSLSRLDRVLAFDADSGVLQMEAGVILEAADEYLRARDHVMPLDLGAKGSCQVGGNVATNAGGLRFLRYGSMHANVLGLEVVRADGAVLDMMSTLRKDNVGYDLKQLFIGSEGTLGVVTRLAIAVPRRPAAVNLALLGCASFEAVRACVGRAKTLLGEVLSAAEFEDAAAMQMVLSTLNGVRDPLPSRHAFYVVIETAGSAAAHDVEKLNGFLEAVMADGTVSDGVVAQDGAQAGALWRLREEVAVAAVAHGAVYKYDVSLPLGRMYELVEATRARVAALGRTDIVTMGYGHLGDCNLHLNVCAPAWDDALCAALEPFVFDTVIAARGSISAEHGLGQSKAKYLGAARSPAVVALMRDLKRVLDPAGILNPGKVLEVL